MSEVPCFKLCQNSAGSSSTFLRGYRNGISNEKNANAEGVYTAIVNDMTMTSNC